MAPNPSIIPLLALLLGSSSAFVTPTSSGGVSSWSLPNPQSTSRSSATSGIVTRRAANSSLARPRTSSSLRMVDGVAEEKAARLRETAASFRAEAAELENKREQDRRADAERSFRNFDSNNDGAVDAAELKAGLEGPLRRSFTKQLTARVGRKLSREEVRPISCGGLGLVCRDLGIFEEYGGRVFPLHSTAISRWWCVTLCCL